MITVLIADDDASIRASLRLLIDAEPGMSVVAVVANADDAVTTAGTLLPDVVLMDVRMPGTSGIDATAAITRRGAVPRVIVLTTFDLDEYVYASLRAGAAGFLLKNSPPADILRAIRVAAEGNALLAPEVTARLVQRFVRPRADPRLTVLTERERETLVLIAQGLSNAEIAGRMFVTVTTVRTYVSRILTKLGVRDRAGLVVVGWETGLVGRRD